MPRKKKTPAAAKAKETSIELIESAAIDPKNMKFWRALALKILPDESDDWHIGEVATFMKLQSELLAKHWQQASRIADKSENSTLSFSIPLSIVRKQTPPSVHVKLSFTEKHGGSAESDVPDPNQTELPGLSEEVTPESEETATAVESGD